MRNMEDLHEKYGMRIIKKSTKRKMIIGAKGERIDMKLEGEDIELVDSVMYL